MKRLLRHSRQHSAGFTLLEVLVALAVLAVALVALIKGVGASTVNASYLRDKTFAHWVAMNVVAERQLLMEGGSPGKESGEAEMGGQRWAWEARQLETFDAAMWRLEVDVRAVGDDSDSALSSIVAFLPRPEGEGQ